MSDATALHGLAEDVLAACVTILNTIPDADPALAGAPDRAFVSPGEPAWDCCEQLTVHTPGVGEQSTGPLGAPGNAGRRHVFGKIPLARIVVTVGRCVPQGTVIGTTWQPPDPAGLEAAAAQINADGWALHNGIFNRVAQGLLSDRCSEVIYDGLESATPTGGCAGWTFEIRFQLDGYGYTEAQPT